MPSSNSTAVSARDLTREYRMGETLIRAVIGASGSGKSTLLNLIAGLDRPTSGSITVNGRDVAQMSAEELARYRRFTVGMVFQAFNLIPSMTLLENVELPMRFAEVDRAERAREALERVGLSARVTHRPVELSGGEQQRASIARALVNRPTLLLADEPTGNLDSRTGEEIMNYLREYHDSQGLTVLLVTHERALADRYAQRILTLADGRLVDDTRVETVAVQAQRGERSKLTTSSNWPRATCANRCCAIHSPPSESPSA
jgi:putative ABC transport system ATP-binding protein